MYLTSTVTILRCRGTESADIAVRAKPSRMQTDPCRAKALKRHCTISNEEILPSLFKTLKDTGMPFQANKLRPFPRGAEELEPIIERQRDDPTASIATAYVSVNTRMGSLLSDTLVPYHSGPRRHR